MKKLLVASVLLALPLGLALADDGTDVFVDLLRSDLRADKEKIVELALDLDKTEADVFWPIYGDYEKEVMAIGDRTVDLLKRYPDAVNLTGTETLRPLSAEWFKVQEDRVKVMQKYYKKVEKQVSLRTAVRWMQVEHRLNLLINLQLASATPLVKPIGKQ